MLAYRNAAAVETPAFQWDDDVTTPNNANADIAKVRMDRQVKAFMELLKGDEVFIAISDDDTNCFRRQVLPSYKANRKDKVRPSCLAELKQYLIDRRRAVRRPCLEADDLMGIKATRPDRDYESVLVTIDKDLRQIPGVYYNPFPHKKEPVEEVISAIQGEEHWMMQTLTGDECDGYKGCPGIGPVKAKSILQEQSGYSIESMWEAVVKTFVSKGLTEADALVQARASRILRHGEWNPKTGVKLWSPQSKQACP